MNIIIIDRATWRCGGEGIEGYANGQGKTYLLNQEGFMCCLGQYSKLNGIPNESLLGEGLPTSSWIIQGDRKGLENLVTDDGMCSQFTDEAVEANDDKYITNEEREARLTKLALEHNDETWTFIGEYVEHAVSA